MPYTPDPNNAAAPIDGEVAGSAAAEFRALKGKVNGLDLTKADRVIIGGVTFPITVGAANSGGIGFRTLLIPN